MAAVAVTVQRPHVPLTVEQAGQEKQLKSIYEETRKWYGSANKYQNDWENADFETPSYDGDNTPGKTYYYEIYNYYTIGQKITELVAAKLGYYGPKKTQQFSSHQIWGAYDTSGRLQGVAVIQIKNSKNKQGNASEPVVHISYLVTAIWNMKFPNPKREWRTGGVATCLLSNITQQIPHLAAIFVEPTPESETFYQGRSFQKVPNWVPRTEGASCGMYLYRKNFPIVQELAKSQLVSKTDDDNKEIV